MDKTSDWMERFLRDTAWEKGKTAVEKPEGPPPPPEKSCPSGARVINLTEPGLLDDVPVNFLETVELRASVRRYNDEPLSF